VLAIFALTTRSLVQRAGQDQPALAALVPLLVFARAWAQGIGIAIGLAHLVAERIASPAGGVPRQSDSPSEVSPARRTRPEGTAPSTDVFDSGPGA
jgi:hypothetical protein